MDLKMFLVFTAFLLHTTLGFPIQDNSGNSTATTEPTQVTTEEDIYESPSPIETDSEDEVIFNRILKVNKDCSRYLQEGDIVPQRSRSAINCRNCYWPQSSDGIVRVPYVLDPTYEESHVKGIQEAMAEFETLTCINFVKRKTERDYLSIKSADGCWSNYGKVGGGQTVSVMKGGCMWKGIIQHELDHALGFLHEHSRSDRDKYVKIMWEYISPADRPDFKKFENSNNLGLPYDYSSVMHYGPYTFTNTTGKATIVPIPDGAVHIGQRQGLSNMDVAKINKLYNCSRCSTILDAAFGSLKSANHPRNYSHNTNCVWLIRTRSRKISLHFRAFELQKTRGCQGDYVKVYDGSSKSSTVLMDKTCGSKIPTDVVASSNLMLVEFVTDGAGTASGFQATFTSGLQQEFDLAGLE
ncbi:astacin-like metalloendopeptidase [Cygnus atratus]|uniref:astacin-like metalloendopeptidase n=1 Tax=Cygnus atratus TaxID=8868 RepID=UPI0021B76A2A|nr:astacin-like metalloendopeptidase [Cygnus atratus]